MYVPVSRKQYMSDDEVVTRILTDGGFGRKLGEYEGKQFFLVRKPTRKMRGSA
jgi:hypothetical protein